MKILIHSNAPWVTTGYATQTRTWARKFHAMGHEVVISAFAGLSGAPMVWDGLRVIPSTFAGDPLGSTVLKEHLEREKADLIITLCDVWALEAGHMRGLPLACWIPIDCRPMSLRDVQCLRDSGAVPVAMSRFGEQMLREADFDPLYVPHAVDLDSFQPSATRDEAREQLRVTGMFVVGINAANKDSFRKGMAEQYEAFARLHARHPQTALLVHSMIMEKSSLDLRTLEVRLGLEGAVRYVDQYALMTGQVSQEHMVAWYSALDLYSACSLGEGFCIPVVEAMACGVPVVATDASTGPELCGGQWLVGGEPFWNAVHGAWWTKPLIGSIHKVYETAYRRGPEYRKRQARARATAEPYSVDRVAEKYWAPALAALKERFCPPVKLTEPQPAAAPAISVCFASRGRPESLRAAVASLLENAAEPDTIEVLIAIDPDDDATAQGCDLAGLPGRPASLRVAPERYGYTQLHRYLNDLAGVAAGEWLMWWNDDMRMTTPGWDKVVRGSRPAVLWPHANHVQHANIAPAWPRAWSTAAGRVSPTTHMDTYLQRVGEALGRHDKIPVEIVHDRADVTGGHDDTTYAEGRKLLGPEGMVDEQFPYDQVAVDAAVIRRLLT